MTNERNAPPRNFFLNEIHELSPEEKAGGGSIPKYEGISWTKKAREISSSLAKVVDQVESSDDPLKGERYFVVARPVPTIKKRSVNKQIAPDGIFEEPTVFGGEHGRVFDRLGLDLIRVTKNGDAVVHANKETVLQLEERSKALNSLGAREQARWATIQAFEEMPFELRIDGDWLASLSDSRTNEVVFELQPLLGRLDSERVLRAITGRLQSRGERVVGSGTDFSGRHWFRGTANRSSIRRIAKGFYSVQSIHPPLYSVAAAARQKPNINRSVPLSQNSNAQDPKLLPCVAVVDLGIPSDHVHLAKFRRGQFFTQGAVSQTASDHGSFVASRVVFGDWESDVALSNANGVCSFYDAIVASDGNKVGDKLVMDAVAGVRGAAPDVRVFNFSFGDIRPLRDLNEVEQREKRLLVQDLDNFIFANDVVVVVAAGNSPAGVKPSIDYPGHVDELQWSLGSWACGFNTLVCGSYVNRLSANGLVQHVGWPSPFSRVGPGICGAPLPSFGAPGGNTDVNFNWSPGADVGVYGYSGAGLPEDRSGTSFAAPLLAQVAALAIARLRQFCIGGMQPYGVTVRAFLALTAAPTSDDSQIGPLLEKTLGYGDARADRIAAPIPGSAVILWQGIIESSHDKLRVQIPVPRAWVNQASSPVLRIAVCADPPVNEASNALWACRRVKAVLHYGPDAPFVRGSRQHNTYPLSIHEYKLSGYGQKGVKPAKTDMWVLEMSYDEIFEYPAGMEFDSRQRVAFAAELVDRGPNPVDPQIALQALPIAASMNRFALRQADVRLPIIVRTRT